MWAVLWAALRRAFRPGRAQFFHRQFAVVVFVQLLERIAAQDVHKKIFIIAFGGGVIGDLAGYIAATYKRGVPYIQVPTTLLAQIDSAIGGKVGIDLKTGKNMAGAFYQPKVVLSDVDFLKTLSQRQVRNGLAEAVKYGIIRDKILFTYIAKHYPKLLRLNPEALTKVVLKCSAIKADVVRQDERETKGIRTILNFGHTVGHAIEAASGYDHYHHGEAVALGMRVAADISTRLGLLNFKEAIRIHQVLDNIGLPQKIRKVSIKSILARMQHDKKFRAGKNRFVLATAIGRVKVLEGVPLRIVTQAIKALM